MIVTYTYRADTGVEKHEGVLDFAALVQDPEVFFWVDMQSPSDEESYVLTHDFKFHPLSIEDVIMEVPNPKIDTYDDYMFVVFKIADYFAGTTGLNTKEVDTFLMKNGVVTVHKEPVRPLEIIGSRCMRDDRVLSRGAGFLFHSIIDYLVDHYNTTMEGIEGLELVWSCGQAPIVDGVEMAPGKAVSGRSFIAGSPLAFGGRRWLALVSERPSAAIYVPCFNGEHEIRIPLGPLRGGRLEQGAEFKVVLSLESVL